MIIWGLVVFVANISAVIYRKKTIECIPVSVAFTMLQTYIFSLLGEYSLIKVLVYAEILVALAILFFFTLKRRERIIGTFSWELLVYILALILSCIVYKNHFVIHGDDYNYYAIFVKTVWGQNGLPDVNTCNFPRYIGYSPIVGLWNASVETLNGEYKEDLMFMCQMMLMYSFSSPILTAFKSKNRTQMVRMSILKSVIFISFPFCLNSNFVSSLGVDTIVGIMFLTIMYKLLYEERNRWLDYIEIAMLMSVFVLVKSPVILFAIICILFMLVVEFEKLKGKLKYWISTSLATVLTYVSWFEYCHRIQQFDYLQRKAINSVLYSHDGLFIMPQYYKKVMADYGGYLLKGSMSTSGRMISVGLMLVLALSLGVVIAVREGVTKEVKAIIISVIGEIVYIISILYMYLFVFEEWEAQGLTRCVIRYMLMYNYMFIGLLVIIAFNKYEKVGVLLALYLVICIDYKETLLVGYGNYLNCYLRTSEMSQNIEYKIRNLPKEYNSDEKVLIYGRKEESANAVAYYVTPVPCVVINEDLTDINLADFDITHLYNYNTGQLRALSRD